MYVPNPDTAPNAVQPTDDTLTNVSEVLDTAEKVSNLDDKIDATEKVVDLVSNLI